MNCVFSAGGHIEVGKSQSLPLRSREGVNADIKA